ncbi:MAG TPA: cobalamin-dependent protein [Phycisphaerales bacterium]|nr:cobalamin-dependent protein [Phycisphaerales bacterium]
MNTELLSERLHEALINGDRPAARAVVADAARAGATPEQIVTDLFWPVYEDVQKLYRADKMTRLAHHFATRLLRVLVDQTAQSFTKRQSVGRNVFAICGPEDADELAAQMAVDLLEREGFTITFAGGGIANDEILERVQETQPDALLIFASAPTDLPNIRSLIDQIREIGACANVQTVVGGGVFNRAEGLAAEIGADLWANSPAELAQAMMTSSNRRADAEQQTVGRKRRLKSQAA